jgi:hypothetical protein
MAVREQNLEATGAIYLTFEITQTGGIDDLKDQDIGCALQLVSSNRVKPAADGTELLGKLVALTLTDADSGKRKATVQVAGVMKLAIAATYPVAGNRVIGAAGGKVKQAPALTGYDPAGGSIARGMVLAVNGTNDCTLLLD